MQMIRDCKINSAASIFNHTGGKNVYFQSCSELVILNEVEIKDIRCSSSALSPGFRNKALNSEWLCHQVALHLFMSKSHPEEISLILLWRLKSE